MANDGGENMRETGAHQTEQVRTGSDRFPDWMDTGQAVLYCQSKGLSRTPKTLRKSCIRGDVTCRQQPASNGGHKNFYERASLDVFVREQLEIDRGKRSTTTAPEDHKKPPETGEKEVVVVEPTHDFIRQQIDKKDEQLAKKDEQIERKDRQIEKLNETL